MEKFDRYDKWYSQWKGLINMINDNTNGKIW